MVYSDHHMYLTWGGTQLGGVEQWQTGLRFAPPSVSTSASRAAALAEVSLTDIWTALTTWWTTNNANVSWVTSQRLTFVKLAVITPEGHYEHDPRTYGGSVPGVGATYPPPPQLAVVVSLRSGQTIGVANRGRMYMPQPAGWNTVLDPATGLVPLPNANGLRDATRTLINSVKGEIDTLTWALKPAIMSTKGSGSWKEIQQIGCGRVIDTQRRRRNELADTVTNLIALA